MIGKFQRSSLDHDLSQYQFVRFFRDSNMFSYCSAQLIQLLRLRFIDATNSVTVPGNLSIHSSHFWLTTHHFYFFLISCLALNTLKPDFDKADLGFKIFVCNHFSLAYIYWYVF